MPQNYVTKRSRSVHRLRGLITHCIQCSWCLRGETLETLAEYSERQQNGKKINKQLSKCLQNIQFFVRQRAPKKILSFKDALIAADLIGETIYIDSHPVLNIGLGFSAQDLRVSGRRQIIYMSYQETKWDKMMKDSELAHYSYFSSYDEPIVDGYPASIWFEMFEPALGILFTLEKLKNRKTNLTKKR